jgi:putative multiple sugar transport system ATP-binding protein
MGTNITAKVACTARRSTLDRPAAIEAGLAYVTEDRKRYGLNLIDTSSTTSRCQPARRREARRHRRMRS